jgi:hypothetical protein
MLQAASQFRSAQRCAIEGHGHVAVRGAALSKLDESRLTSLPPFSRLSRLQIREILDQATPRRHEEGTAVFGEGAAGRALLSPASPGGRTEMTRGAGLSPFGISVAGTSGPTRNCQSSELRTGRWGRPGRCIRPAGRTPSTSGREPSRQQRPMLGAGPRCQIFQGVASLPFLRRRIPPAGCEAIRSLCRFSATWRHLTGSLLSCGRTSHRKQVGQGGGKQWQR